MLVEVLDQSCSHGQNREGVHGGGVYFGHCGRHVGEDEREDWRRESEKREMKEDGSHGCLVREFKS